MLPKLPILEKMYSIEGWMAFDEAELLAVTVERAILATPDAAVVEVGSYCGRSTVVLAGVARELKARPIVAIDPHEGVFGLGDERAEPTLDRLRRNLVNTGLNDFVRVLVERSHDVVWSEPIGLLFVDGLHGYDDVSADFRHFEPHIVAGGLAAFHDYGASCWPDVTRFVDELMSSNDWEFVRQAGSMVVLRSTKQDKAPSMFYHSFERTIAGTCIIYLPGNPLSERLAERCRQSCEDVGQAHTLYPGVDGTSGTIVLPDHLQGLQPLRWLKVSDPGMSITELGCALSHISAWMRCIDLDRPIVILEHDVIMVRRITEHRFLNSVIYLGCKDSDPKSTEPDLGCFDNNLYWPFMKGAHAYAIDPWTARHLLASILERGINERLDVMIRPSAVSIIYDGRYAMEQPEASTVSKT